MKDTSKDKFKFLIFCHHSYLMYTAIIFYLGRLVSQVKYLLLYAHFGPYTIKEKAVILQKRRD
jgi:hypothetical protein